MRGEDLRTLGLAALGAMLEFYDFVVYLFVASAIGEAFFPPSVSSWTRQLETFAIFAIGYLVRPLAGIAMAHFGDTIGRKKMFVFLIVLMAIPTLGIGLLPTYAQVGTAAPIALLVLRALQGCAVGGELPGAAVFVSEHAARTRLGTSSGVLHGIVHLGLLLGTGSAALAAWIALKSGMPSLAWRLPFLAGGVFGLVAAWLRRYLEESPVYAEIQRSKALSRTLPLKSVLTEHAGACGFGFALMFVMATCTTIVFQFMPSLLITWYGVSRETVLHANLWGTFALAFSMPLWGYASDRLGWSFTLGAGAMATLAAATGFFHTLPDLIAGHGPLAVYFSILGVAIGAVIAVVPGLTSSLFPTQVRQSGYAVPYNLSAAIFAGLWPLVLAWLVSRAGPQVPLYPVIAAALVSAVLAVKVGTRRLYLGARQGQNVAPAHVDRNIV